ncbi:MAG: DNA polymerase III subunit epsilon [Alphaproteobacteria bacterium]|nr:DNA polymerase III subunit epsilon [Alphaproteobacteria bacterium]
MREIVLDTETTGLDPSAGHRVIEIGCIALVNHIPTDETFHRYINPERDMPAEAFAVHGLSEAFLAKHPVFADIADEFLAFVGEAPLVIHNASFDIGFLNAELKRIDRPTIPMRRAIDTVQLARAKFPGAQASLDALCRRFEIDNSSRTKHGALLDAELLSLVYLELVGGRQPGLELAASGPRAAVTTESQRPLRPARPHAPSEDERRAHAALVDTLENPIWRQ